ncbi:MAG: prepilin-type N-terminal cleavage/methylation domain-containing protein [Proteobacteria bacterium]|nr:prepilin-type N-terminal cleavage/methylation domain-containing protein [Pseudomonadota bacterium]
MKKTFSSKKSAFSLIELSIVLIIIGLLIAGITGGASLIKNSELRALSAEARGYQVAVNGFYSLYNSLPGDYPQAIAGSIASSATTLNGDNSKIEYYESNVSTYLSESVVAWDQLIKTGTIDSTLSLTKLAVSSQQVVGTNMPAAKIKFAGWHFDYRNRVGSSGDYSKTNQALGAVQEGGSYNPQNVAVLTGTTTAVSATTATLVNGTTNGATAALIGPDAYALDTKVDDGKANSGKVRGLNPNAVDGTCYTASTSATASYIISSSTTKVCALTFQVDPKSS